METPSNASAESHVSTSQDHSSPLQLNNIDYPAGFYHEQAPIHLNYICALHGIPGPSLTDAFHYCELGCGVGETSCILAVANPTGQFVGIDLSASHISAAKEMADAGELTNTRFICADISDFDSSGLPDFDFITLHGLYAWVPRTVQRGILKFIKSKLKPGGIVYVSYNALPGQAGALPVRRFFLEMAARIEGDLPTKARQILQQLNDMRSKGALFFSENPVVARMLEELSDADPHYLAHEFFAGAWQPLYFDEVNRDMEGIGLRFVADGGVIDNLIEHSTVPAFIDALHAIKDPVQHETMRDFIQNRSFRRDLYIKLDNKAKATSQLPESLDNSLFGMALAPLEIRDTVKVFGEEELDMGGHLLERLKQLLEYTAMSLQELRADPVLKDCPLGELVRTLILLSTGGQIMPFLTRGSKPAVSFSKKTKIEIVPPLNRQLLTTSSDPKIVLASPVRGTGIIVNGLESMLLQGLENDDPVHWIWQVLCERDVKMVAQGQTMQTEETNIRAVRGALKEFRAKKLPKLAYLGIVEVINS